MKYHPSTIDTATLREIAFKYHDPKTPVEGLILHGAEAELQRRQDEAPLPISPRYRKAAFSRDASVTAATLNAHHFLVGLTTFNRQRFMTEYADKLADAMGEGLDSDSARQYAGGSFALGLLLLGMPEDEEDEATDELPLATRQTESQSRQPTSPSKTRRTRVAGQRR